jgi:hypothetical protein
MSVGRDAAYSHEHITGLNSARIETDSLYFDIGVALKSHHRNMSD